MAAPNILNVTTLYGYTALMNVTTVQTSIVSNGASSGQVYKIDNLLVTNIGTNNEYVTARFVRSSVSYSIANTITIPANTTLVLVSKSTNIYLQEGDSIDLIANSNNTLQSICSYEVIS